MYKIVGSVDHCILILKFYGVENTSFKIVNGLPKKNNSDHLPSCRGASKIHSFGDVVFSAKSTLPTTNMLWFI